MACSPRTPEKSTKSDGRPIPKRIATSPQKTEGNVLEPAMSYFARGDRRGLGLAADTPACPSFIALTCTKFKLNVEDVVKVFMEAQKQMKCSTSDPDENPWRNAWSTNKREYACAFHAFHQLYSNTYSDQHGAFHNAVKAHTNVVPKKHAFRKRQMWHLFEMAFAIKELGTLAKKDPTVIRAHLRTCRLPNPFISTSSANFNGLTVIPESLDNVFRYAGCDGDIKKYPGKPLTITFDDGGKLPQSEIQVEIGRVQIFSLSSWQKKMYDPFDVATANVQNLISLKARYGNEREVSMLVPPEHRVASYPIIIPTLDRYIPKIHNVVLGWTRDEFVSHKAEAVKHRNITAGLLTAIVRGQKQTIINNLNTRVANDASARVANDASAITIQKWWRKRHKTTEMTDQKKLAKSLLKIGLHWKTKYEKFIQAATRKRGTQTDTETDTETDTDTDTGRDTNTLAPTLTYDMHV